MDLYRKKPLTVEAVQWFPGVEVPGLREVPGPPPECTPDGTAWPGHGVLQTPYGEVLVLPGWWLVHHPEGYLRPWDGAYFEANFEKVG
jgi:hypothetical protein